MRNGWDDWLSVVSVILRLCAIDPCCAESFVARARAYDIQEFVNPQATRRELEAVLLIFWEELTEASLNAKQSVVENLLVVPPGGPTDQKFDALFQLAATAMDARRTAQNRGGSAGGGSSAVGSGGGGGTPPPVVLKAMGTLQRGKEGGAFKATATHYVVREIYFHKRKIDLLVQEGLAALGDGTKLTDVCISCLLCAPSANADPLHYCLTYASSSKLMAFLPRSDWFTAKLAKDCLDSTMTVKGLPAFFQ